MQPLAWYGTYLCMRLHEKKRIPVVEVFVESDRDFPLERLMYAMRRRSCFVTDHACLGHSTATWGRSGIDTWSLRVHALPR